MFIDEDQSTASATGGGGQCDYESGGGLVVPNSPSESGLWLYSFTF
jgi:hypothetical protein